MSNHSLKQVLLEKDIGDIVVNANGAAIEIRRDGAVDVYTDSQARIHPLPGDVMSDGTIFAGTSPVTGKPMYAAPSDAPLTMRWEAAKQYAEDRGTTEKWWTRFVAEGKPQTVVAEHCMRRDGLELTCEWTLTPLVNDDGEVTSIVLQGRDITQQRAAERMRSEFTSTLSHELRTPLTSILGSLQLMRSGALGDQGLRVWPRNRRESDFQRLARTGSRRTPVRGRLV